MTHVNHNNPLLRSTTPAPILPAPAPLAANKVVMPTPLASISNLDTVQFSPLAAKQQLQQTRADLSPAQVNARVAASLLTFLDSPVSDVLANELPSELENNPTFALLMSEKAVEFLG
ncbi:MAG: hypothetical protein HEQ32_02800 [Vampirovibrio sp.]|jgi:hypothetical protein